MRGGQVPLYVIQQGRVSCDVCGLGFTQLVTTRKAATWMLTEQ